VIVDSDMEETSLLIGPGHRSGSRFSFLALDVSEWIECGLR